MYKPNGISDAQHRKGNDITVTSEHDMQVFRTNFESGHEVFFSHLSLLINSSGQIRIATYGPCIASAAWVAFAPKTARPGPCHDTTTYVNSN